MDKKDLVLADKEFLISQLKHNIIGARREIAHAKFQIEDKTRAIAQYEEEIKKQEAEMQQINGGSN